MNYFESLKTDFLIVQSFIIAIILLVLIAKTILFPDDNFIIIFTSRTLFLIFLLVVLFILKNKGLKIAGNIFGLGAMAIALIPMNIFVDDISVMYKYMYGFYIVFFILAYVLLFSNRIVLIINTVLILITTTRIYFYAASHSLEDVLFFQVGYANHSAVVILTSIVFYT